jgi:methylenetetrahydrofolate dehydrogenase (NADP+)/methenyltetrahydrofolate cyclohydrolase
VHGILVQLPLPAGIDPAHVARAIAPAKDVDGLHPENAGQLMAGRPALYPCTPLGCIEILQRHGVRIEGARAVVLGRSNIVGRPLALLLEHHHATVTICHSRTRDLPDVVRCGEIVVAAVGQPLLVQGDWIRPGAAVIDVGIHRQPDGKLVGDVDFAAAAQRASLITPVPGGVGPLTIAMLLANTAAAYERSLGRSPA